MWIPLRGATDVDSLTWTLLICGPAYVEPPTWTLLHGPCFPYVEPLRGLSNMDPAYVDLVRGAPYVGIMWTLLMDPPTWSPNVGSLTWTLLLLTPYVEPPTWTPLRGPLYVEAPTWTLLRGPCLCGPPYVEPPTWTFLHGPCLCGPPTWSPNVDSLTWTLLMWTPLRGSLYVDFLTWTLLMWTPPYMVGFQWTPPYMVGFQNGFSQNGALIAIPWGPASKSPLSSNHIQSTGMLNMKGCQWQKL